ncbi:glycosyltransferase family 2 protein, partial [Azospirillum sp. B506]|uniref:glycosyltransferase family 2 protein n=1 Tax=Azospirillum sp. B506 TaxID=137721 RepID=UPI0005B28445
MQTMRSEQIEILGAVHRDIAEAQAFLRNALADAVPVPPKPVNRTISIGVPIYNRHVETQDLIAVLCRQICQLDQHIAVDIHDNGKDERNIRLIEKITEIFPFVRYRGSFCNVGADLNISSLYMFSETPYRWIIGDDDLPAPGALQQIADLVARHGDRTVTLFHLGNLVVDAGLSDIIHDEFMPSSRYEPGVHFLEKDQSILDIGREFLRMSANIVKVLPLHDVVNRHLVGLEISPICFNLNALTYGKCCFINHPLLVYREGDKSHWISRWPRIAHYHFPKFLGEMARNGLLSTATVDSFFKARPEFVFGANADRTSAFNHLNWHRMLAATDLDGAEANLAGIDLMSGLLKGWADGQAAEIDCLLHRRAFRPDCVGDRAPGGFEIDERLMYVIIPANGGGSAGFRLFGIPAYGQAVCDLQTWVRDDGQPPVVSALGMRPSGDNGPFRQVAALVPTPGRSVRCKVPLGRIEGPIDLEIRFTLDGRQQAGTTALCVVKRLVVSLSEREGCAEK